MKTIEIKLYQFSELSQSAKERALELQREFYFETGIPFIQDAFNTINEFCHIIGAKFISVDYSYRNDISYKFNADDHLMDMKPMRLRTWIINNWLPYMSKGKYYSTPGKWINGKYYYKKRYSKIQFEYDNCPLTGVSYDCDILKPLLNFIEKPTDIDIKDIVSECFNSMLNSLVNEYEYILSDEYLIQDIEANGYNYTEYGYIY